MTFDDEHAVAAAGLLLPATLAGRLGIEALAYELIDLGDKPGAHRPGRKVMTLMHSLVLGGDCIDDADVLRSGSTGAVLGHRVMAPSTLGTFLRSLAEDGAAQVEDQPFADGGRLPPRGDAEGGVQDGDDGDGPGHPTGRRWPPPGRSPAVPPPPIKLSLRHKQGEFRTFNPPCAITVRDSRAPSEPTRHPDT